MARKNVLSLFSYIDLQKGQALLVIVLIMVVVLTIGLSLATRSIINTRSSTEENNSQEAFAAAEAGIERLLQSQQSAATGAFSNQVSYSASTVSGSQSEFLLNGGEQVLRGEGADLWLSTYPDYSTPWPISFPGTFTLYWGSAGGDCNAVVANVAAIEVVVLTGADRDNPSAEHFVFDPCSNRRAANKFNGASAASRRIGNQDFVWSGTVTLAGPNRGFIARIIPLYSNTKIGVIGNPALPPQGKRVESVGTAGETARKISVFQSYPRLPIEIFPYVIFSP